MDMDDVRRRQRRAAAVTTAETGEAPLRLDEGLERCVDGDVGLAAAGQRAAGNEADAGGGQGTVVGALGR
jgi:hypothetical protein